MNIFEGYFKKLTPFKVVEIEGSSICPLPLIWLHKIVGSDEEASINTKEISGIVVDNHVVEGVVERTQMAWHGDTETFRFNESLVCFDYTVASRLVDGSKSSNRTLCGVLAVDSHQRNQEDSKRKVGHSLKHSRNLNISNFSISYLYLFSTLRN